MIGNNDNKKIKTKQKNKDHHCDAQIQNEWGNLSNE